MNFLRFGSWIVEIALVMTLGIYVIGRARGWENNDASCSVADGF
jgi:hypothetical protein